MSPQRADPSRNSWMRSAGRGFPPTGVSIGAEAAQGGLGRLADLAELIREMRADRRDRDEIADE